MKHITRAVLMFALAVLPAILVRAEFALDLGVSSGNGIDITYYGFATIQGNQGPLLESNILIYDVTNVSENTDLSSLTPAFQIGISWQSNALEDMTVSDNTDQADLQYTTWGQSDWSYAQVNVGAAISGHHYVIVVDSSDNLGALSTDYAENGAASESGHYSDSLEWHFSQ